MTNPEGLRLGALAAIAAMDDATSVRKSATAGTPAHAAFQQEELRAQRKAGKACIAYVRSQALLTAQGVGDGVLVPREPTPKMVDATWNDPIETNGGIESHNTRNRRIYAAMLAAAPAPEAAAAGEQERVFTPESPATWDELVAWCNANGRGGATDSEAIAAFSKAHPADKGSLVHHAIKLLRRMEPWDGKTYSKELGHTLKLLAALATTDDKGNGDG